MNPAVEAIGQVVKAMQLMPNKTWLNGKSDTNELPYYMFGHRLEISNRLLEKNQDKVFKYKKYPLIALRMDFPERVYEGLWHFDLNIAILAFTDKNYNAEERYENVFKPILYPLYRTFLEKIKHSGLFMWPGDQSVAPHTKIDRPYWGIEEKEKNSKYIFNDPLDAIEIVNLRINQIFKC